MSNKVVADRLFCVEALRLPVEFELVDLTAKQKENEEFKLTLEAVPISDTSAKTISKAFYNH